MIVEDRESNVGDIVGRSSRESAADDWRRPLKNAFRTHTTAGTLGRATFDITISWPSWGSARNTSVIFPNTFGNLPHTGDLQRCMSDQNPLFFVGLFGGSVEEKFFPL